MKTLEIKNFQIPQLVGAGEQGLRQALPSFVYFPLDEEKDAKATAIAWDDERETCVGTFARERGKELPRRMIASAKSWLCHGGIDRRAKILPRVDGGGEEEGGLMSPLEACAQFLSHLRKAWDNTTGETNSPSTTRC